MNIEALLLELSRFLWPMFRLTGLLMTIPVLGSQVVPLRIKIIFLISLMGFCYFLEIYTPIYKVVELRSIFWVFQEVSLGIMMGFIFQMVLQSFVLAGHIIAMQTGLGFAVLVNPLSSSNVPLVSQFYLLLVSLLFLIFNGHLLLIDFLIQSFKVYPIASDYSLVDWLKTLIFFSGYMFSGAVLLSVPLIMSLLTVNMGFGVMSRAVPQLNIISVGFPITLTLGLYVIYLTIGSIADYAYKSFSIAISVFKSMGL